MLLPVCKDCTLSSICDGETEEYREQCVGYSRYKQGYDDALEKAWSVFQKYATFMHPRHEREECIMNKSQFLKAIVEV